MHTATHSAIPRRRRRSARTASRSGSHSSGTASASSAGGRSHHRHARSNWTRSSGNRCFSTRTRIAARHGIGGHILRHYGAGRNDGAVADVDPRQDHALPADPHVVAHHDVPLSGQLAQVRRRLVSPCPAEHLEGVGADAAGPVVGRAHDELGPGRRWSRTCR